MTALPGGVVTLLFTDIEGSTRLWEHNPGTMRAALVRHDALLTSIVERCRGLVVKSRGEGDSFFCIFERAGDGVVAAIAIQRQLDAEQWPTSVPIKVRMALHTGTVDQRERDYYGPTVNRCARLRGLGHGGQILLSGTTADLVKSRLPAGAEAVDLGLHRLKDISEAEQVHQLNFTGLPTEFSPLGVPTPPASLDVDAPAAADGAAYWLLADGLEQTRDGRRWGPDVTNEAPGVGAYEGDGWIHCYRTPLLAIMATPIHGLTRGANLWEVRINHELEDEWGLEIPCTSVTSVRKAPMPAVNTEEYVRFALLCALETHRGSFNAGAYADWAEKRLDGLERTVDAAREAERLADADTYRNGIPIRSALVASYAAQAALHAARGSGFAGRLADSELREAEKLVGLAAATAAEASNLDLAEVAEQAFAWHERQASRAA